MEYEYKLADRKGGKRKSPPDRLIVAGGPSIPKDPELMVKAFLNSIQK